MRLLQNWNIANASNYLHGTFTFYLKYPIPIPIPLSLPKGSALLGLAGLGSLINPLSIHLSPSSTLSFSLFTNGATGTLSICPRPHVAGSGRPMLSLRSHSLREESPVKARPDEREAGSGELNMRRRSMAPTPSRERRIAISAILGRRRRRRRNVARASSKTRARALPHSMPTRAPGDSAGPRRVSLSFSAGLVGVFAVPSSPPLPPCVAVGVTGVGVGVDVDVQVGIGIGIEAGFEEGVMVAMVGVEGGGSGGGIG